MSQDEGVKRLLQKMDGMRREQDVHAETYDQQLRRRAIAELRHDLPFWLKAIEDKVEKLPHIRYGWELVLWGFAAEPSCVPFTARLYAEDDNYLLRYTDELQKLLGRPFNVDYSPGSWKYPEYARLTIRWSYPSPSA